MIAENERFYENPHLTMENLNLRDGVGVENLWTKVPKVTHVRQNWSNKSSVVCASSCV